MPWRIITATVILLVISISAAHPEESGWKLVLEENNLTAYNRDIPGTKLKEIKAIYTVNAPSWRVCEVVCDLDDYRNFMPFVLTSKVLKTETLSDGSKLFVVFHAIQPPLVSIRYNTLDLIRRDDFEKVKGRYKVEWKKSESTDIDWKDPLVKDSFSDDFAPPIKVESNSGYWLLEPVEGGAKTKVTYYVKANPMGDLPPFLTRKANFIMLPKLRGAVSKRVGDSKYDGFKPPGSSN